MVAAPINPRTRCIGASSIASLGWREQSEINKENSRRGLAFAVGGTVRAGAERQIYRAQAEEWTPGFFLRRPFGPDLFDFLYLQCRITRRTGGAHRLRASIRAHDVSRIQKRRKRGTFHHYQKQRRRHEWIDDRRSHGVSRNITGESARSRPIP